jgi:GxxExxY protein
MFSGNNKMEEINAAARAVFAELGPGHSEVVYRNALKFELESRPDTLRVLTEVTFPILFKGISVGFQRADIVWEKRSNEKVLLELKTVQNVPPIVISQVKRYLTHYPFGKLDLGVIVNFHPAEVQTYTVTND